jgi:hypothetical protein
VSSTSGESWFYDETNHACVIARPWSMGVESVVHSQGLESLVLTLIGSKWLEEVNNLWKFSSNN